MRLAQLGSNPFGTVEQKPTVQQKVESIVKLIQDTVESESWKDNGGAIGSIANSTGTRHHQTPETHAKLKELLAKLPDQQARLVHVRADWIFAAPDQLRFDEAKAQGALREIDRAMIDKLPKDVVCARAETTCFTGQTVSIVSGRHQSYVSDLSPIVGTQAVAMDPVISVFQAGAELQVTPTIQTDGKSAVVDLHSIVSDWDEAPAYELHGDSSFPTTRGSSVTSAATGTNQIQRPRPVMQQLHTTLRVPMGKSIVVGGMTSSRQCTAWIGGNSFSSLKSRAGEARTFPRKPDWSTQASPAYTRFPSSRRGMHRASKISSDRP